MLVVCGYTCRKNFLLRQAVVIGLAAMKGGLHVHAATTRGLLLQGYHA